LTALRPLARQLALAWGAAVVAGAALLPRLGRHVELLPACPLRAATGWPCPACGSGRAVAALAGGDWLAAFAWNPLAILALALFAAAGLAAAAGELAGRPLGEPRELPGWARLGLPAVIAADWLYLAWKLA